MRTAPPRFVGGGSWSERLRAGLAGPLIDAGAWVAQMVGTVGGGRAARSFERHLASLGRAVADIKLEARGLDLIDPSERYVVAALHEGLADVLALLRLPLRLRFVARDELFEWAGVGRWLRAGKHTSVDRHSSLSSLRQLHRDAGRAFEEGDSLVLFAQGTILGIETAFQPGALRLALRFGRPILPVVISGSHRVWEHPFSSTFRSGQRVSLVVLEPVAPDRLTAERLRVVERQMKGIALGPEMAPPRHYRPEVDGWWDEYEFEIDPDFPDLRARVEAHRLGSMEPQR